MDKSTAILILFLLGFVSSASLTKQESGDAEVENHREKRGVGAAAAAAAAALLSSAAKKAITSLLKVAGAGAAGQGVAEIADFGSTCVAESCAWGSVYPCHRDTKFNYGCLKLDGDDSPGYCWSGCSVTGVSSQEWCYTASKSDSQYMRCNHDNECGDGASCATAYCKGGCSV